MTGATVLCGPWPSSKASVAFSDRVTICFLQGGIVNPTPNHQPVGPGPQIYVTQRQGGLAIPPGTGFPF
jgi:hypothetical protein